MINIKYTTTDEELLTYVHDLSRFLKMELKQELTSKSEIAQILLEIVLGSRNTRQGRAPEIEIQANIIKVIKACMDLNLPIPVLVGAGPKKTSNHHSIDIAELSALQILGCVNDKVREFYKPGLEIKIRLEDLTGFIVEGDSNQVNNAMLKYMRDFEVLVKILNYPGISTFKESDLVKKGYFIEVAEKLIPEFLEYLRGTNDLEEQYYTKHHSYSRLVAIGWKGIVPREMRDYLYDKYDKLYPGIKQAEKEFIVARYLAATMARNITESTGKESGRFKMLGQPLEMAFAKPTPGIPEGLQSTRVYYRTIPLNHSKKDVPFWRTQGILKVNSQGEVRYSLTTFDDTNLIKGNIILSDEIYSVSISANTIIED